MENFDGRMVRKNLAFRLEGPFFFKRTGKLNLKEFNFP